MVGENSFNGGTTGVATVIAKNCTFEHNRASSDGGAVLIEKGDVFQATSDTFESNTAVSPGGSHGGAIYAYHAKLLNITNNTFVKNSAAFGASLGRLKLPWRFSSLTINFSGGALGFSDTSQASEFASHNNSFIGNIVRLYVRTSRVLTDCRRIGSFL